MSRPWMALHVGDYLADTAHLDATESGAYLHLIMHYWQHGGLPEDDRALQKIAKISSHRWRKIRPILQEFFHDGWRHKRIDRELRKADEITAKRAEAGRKRHEKQPANAEQKQAHARASNNHNHIDTEAKASGADAPPVYTDSRHELWGEGVPILMAFGQTQKAAGKLIGSWLKQTGDDVQQVLGAIQRARDHRPQEPIPWITRALKSPKVDNAKRAHGAHDNFLAGMAAALSERPESRLYAGKDSAGAGPDAGPAEDDREPLLRLAAR
jgi:uncharacterized protein YdaU (DUF1376 family)